jgi:hypothetical protein
MAKTNLRQELSSNTIENGPQPSPLVEKPSDQTPPNKAAPRKGTGPRTVRGKKRSRFNSIKHGVLSKFVLLDGESQAEYISLTNGLQDQFQPLEKLQSVSLEYLAIQLWRLRRYFKAESAVISERIFSMEARMRTKQADEALQLSRDAMTSNGLVAHDDNPFVVKEILDTLETLRQLITGGKISDCLPLIHKLYGANEYGKTPDPFRQGLYGYVEVLKLGKTQGDQSIVSEMTLTMIEMIDGEIERFSTLKDLIEDADHKKLLFRKLAAVIPSRGASDRLLSYETHLNREIDRILNWLERLHRMRKGQPLPPQLDIKIS